MPPNVRVLSTGGTIASTGGEDGASPSKDGTELVESVPELDEHADLTVEQVCQVLSFQMDPDAVAQVGRHVVAAADAGVDGVVVTHGTDTIDESAYFLDVALAPEVPVVFTGAQRRPDETSPDGPANLLTAVRAATHEALRTAGGVYVAFNEELHAARDVVKAHTHKLESFASPGTGPVAVFDRERVRFHRDAGSRSVHIPVLEPTATVEIVPSGLGASGEPIRRALADGVDGLVLQGTGVGNVAPDIADAVDAALDRDVPVVVTSRCHAGAVSGVYGTRGGSRRLLSRGVVSAGDLPAHKARLKLMLAIEAADEGETVSEVF
jgi:L-asparaginase